MIQSPIKGKNMDVLVNGVSSYIGRRAVGNLQAEHFNVHALVRDADLFRATSFESITADLITMDVLKTDANYHSFAMDNVDLGIYFTQSPCLDDQLSLQMELTRLKNFIVLLQRHQCSRMLFIARLMDKAYIDHVREMLEKYAVVYTIILNNVTLGKGSLADRYFRKLMMDKYVWYDEALANIELRPVAALDMLRWIREVDWAMNFKHEILEFGGVHRMSVRDLFRMYKKLNDIDNVGLPVPHKLYNFFFKKNKALHPDDLQEIKRMFEYEYPVDNSAWAKRIPFSFTPIEDVILHDK